MTEIKKAMNYLCADASCVFPAWQVKRLKVRWIKNHKLMRGVTNEGNIVVTPCVIGTDMYKTKFLMDVITGSLYKDGNCMTSDHLKLLSIADEQGLEEELLAARSKALGA